MKTRMPGKRVKPRVRRACALFAVVLLLLAVGSIFLAIVLLEALGLFECDDQHSGLIQLAVFFGFPIAVQAMGRVLLTRLFVRLGWVTPAEAPGFMWMVCQYPASCWESGEEDAEEERIAIDESRIFSTESEYGQRFLRQTGTTCRLAGGIVLCTGAWLTFRHLRAGDDVTRCVASVCVMGLIAVGIVLIPRFYPRGTWELNDDWIRFVPLRGRLKELNWPEIEAVIWDGHRAGVRGRGIRILVPWALIDPDERAPAQQFLESKLGPHFDLSLRNTSVLAWTVILIYAVGLAALEMSLIPFWFCASALLLVGGTGCILKFRFDPIWRRRAADH